MKTISIDCSGIATPAEFWQRYVDVANPEGPGHFGRNLDAFWDALNGGPGWPGEVHLVFTNSVGLGSIRGGDFYEALLEIASKSTHTKVRFQ